MTSSKQPHCEHECVCVKYIHGSPVARVDGTPCMRNHTGCRTCEHDTRTSHSSATEPEQCPYWKDSYNLKSDCRDQGIGKFYCSRGVEGIKEQAKREERERIAKQIEHNASNRKYHSYTTSMQIVEYLRGEQP